MPRFTPAVLTTVAIALAAFSLTAAPAATSVATTQEQNAAIASPLHQPSPSTGIPFTTPDLPPGVLRYDPGAPKAEPALSVYSDPAPVTRDQLAQGNTGGSLGGDVDARLAELPAPSGDDVALAVSQVVDAAVADAGLPGIVSMSYDDATTVVTVPDETTAEQARALTEALPVRIVVDSAQAAVMAVFEAVLLAAGMPVDEVRYPVLPEDVVIADDFTWSGHVIASYQGESGKFTHRQWVTIVELGATYPGVLAVTNLGTVRPLSCSDAPFGTADRLSFTQCDTPGLSGSRITSTDGASCTMGPRLYDPSGAAYVATAGHCTANGTWSPTAADQETGPDWAYGQNQQRLRYSTDNYLSWRDSTGIEGFRDVQLIRVDPETVASSVARRSSGGYATPTPLTSVQSDIVGNQPTCYKGMTSRYPAACGRVTRRRLPIALPGVSHVADTAPGAPREFLPVLVTVTDVTGAISGDSGGPVYSGNKLQGVLSSNFGYRTQDATRVMMFSEMSDERLDHLTVDYYDRTHVRYGAVSNFSNTQKAWFQNGTFSWGRLFWGFPDSSGGATTVKQIRLANGNHRYDVVWNAAFSIYRNSKSGTARLAIGCAENSDGTVEWRELTHLDMTAVSASTSDIQLSRPQSVELAGPACAKLQVRYEVTILRTRYGARSPYANSPGGSPQTWTSTTLTPMSFAPRYS